MAEYQARRQNAPLAQFEGADEGPTPAETASAAASHGFSCRVLRTLEELETVKAFWLANQTRLEVDFDFFTLNAQHDPTFIEPRVFAVHEGGQPVFLVLAQLVEMELPWKIGYLRLMKSPRRFLEIPPGAFVGKANDIAARAFVEALHQSLLDDSLPLARFMQIDESHPVYAHLKAASSALTSDPAPEQDIHRGLDLPATYDAFYDSRSKNEKSNIRKYTNRMRKEFGDAIEIKSYRKPSDVAEAIDLIEGITDKTYQRGLGIGFEDTPLQRAQWEKLSANDQLRIYVLFLGGQPAAFWAGSVYNKVFLVNYTSFDPEFRQVHPGQYALLHMIEEFCSDDMVSQIDYGYGEAAYKRRFGNLVAQDAIIHFFAGSVRGQTLRTARFVVTGLHRGLKSVLTRWNVLDKVKSGWRLRAQRAGSEKN